MKTVLTALCLALLGLPAAAGGLVLFKGPPAGVGEVRVVLASGASYVPPGLDAIRLLGLGVSGRTELERFLPGKAWLEADVPAATRAVLPRRRGSVYHFRRDVGGDGAIFGYFVIDAEGDAWSVFELPGVGAAFDENPFLETVGVAPDGLSMLVATTPKAGGDLFEVSLQPGGGVIDRSELMPPQAILGDSLTLAGGFGVAVTTAGVLRFRRGGVDQASFLTYDGGTPDWWSGDVVLSSNGGWAATVASDSAPLGHVWIFSASGPARRATDVPLPLSGAGHLPTALHGPYLAVSDDGSVAAWRTEGAAREAWLAKVQAPPGQVPRQISSDAYFLDTLDEIGQYAFRPGTKQLVVAVGALSTNVPATLESADYFGVTLDDQGEPQFTNITQTNGVAQAPFLVPPQLDPVAASWTPARDAIVFHDDQGSDQGRLAVLRPDQTGVQTLLDDTKEVFRVDRVGTRMVVVLRRSTGDKDLELHLVDAQLAGTTGFLTAPDTDLFPTRAVRTDGVYTFVQRTPTFDALWSFDTRTQALGLMTPRKFRYGPTLAVGPDDEVGFSLGKLGGVNVFASWRFPDVPKRMPVAPQTAFLLPGI
jgi:hypothetical protein